MKLLFSENRLILKTLVAKKTAATGKEKVRPKGKKLEAAKKIKDKKDKILKKSKIARLAVLKSAPRLSVAKQKEARSYMKPYTSKQIDVMAKKFKKQSIYDLWSKGVRNKHGYAKMTAVFGKATVDKLKQLTVKVNLYGISLLEDHVGAGHVVPESWEAAKICDTQGRCRVGYRKIPGVDPGIQGTKIGYYTENGDYLVIYTGYTITPVRISSAAQAAKQRKREKEFYNKNKDRFKKEYGQFYMPGQFSGANDDQMRYVPGLDPKEATIKRKTEWKANYVRGSKKETKRAFIPQGRKFAKMIEKKYGVPWQVTLSMSVLETGWGTSKYALRNNSFFGIKPRGRLQKKYNQIVRYYFSMYESFVDYGHLMNNSLYRDALKYKDNPLMSLAVITGRGYNPRTDYFKKVLNVMKYGGFGAHNKIGVQGYISKSQLREELGRSYNKSYARKQGLTWEQYLEKTFFAPARRIGKLRD